jgi:hypothetical protein
MNEYVGTVSLEANGQEFDCYSVVPTERIFRERVETMTQSGYVERRPQYGLTVEIVENNNFSENPSWDDITDGTLVIVYKNGSREVYPRAVCLSVSQTGYSPTGESRFTYNFMTAKPVKS